MLAARAEGLKRWNEDKERARNELGISTTEFNKLESMFLKPPIYNINGQQIAVSANPFNT